MSDEIAELRKDKARLDFLDSQTFTRWVGFDTSSGSRTWPVRGRQSFRAEVDKAMEWAAQARATNSDQPCELCLGDSLDIQTAVGERMILGLTAVGECCAYSKKKMGK